MLVLQPELVITWWDGVQTGARRAIQRREISSRTDSRRLLIAATAPLYHHAVLLRAPTNTQLADEAAHDTAVAAAAGAFAGGAAADR